MSTSKTKQVDAPVEKKVAEVSPKKPKKQEAQVLQNKSCFQTILRGDFTHKSILQKLFKPIKQNRLPRP